ncbi:hypothetical protein BDF19DRAFT_251476 [Syncephalis fuscata]|nr:hypothetical protein BDF19DRAFT_251476 [Syncephalis fuscata]
MVVAERTVKWWWQNAKMVVAERWTGGGRTVKWWWQNERWTGGGRTVDWWWQNGGLVVAER